MARGKQTFAPESAPAVADDTTPLDTWIEQQRDLLDTAFSQWTQAQQNWASAWLQWIDGMGGVTGGARLPAWPGIPEEMLMAGPRLMQLWWSPWMPFMERGTEQLA